MSVVIEEKIKHWTAKRKAALVVDIIQGKTIGCKNSKVVKLTARERYRPLAALFTDADR